MKYFRTKTCVHITFCLSLKFTSKNPTFRSYFFQIYMDLLSFSVLTKLWA